VCLSLAKLFIFLVYASILRNINDIFLGRMELLAQTSQRMMFWSMMTLLGMIAKAGMLMTMFLW